MWLTGKELPDMEKSAEEEG